MQKEYFFRIFLKGDTSGKSVETIDTIEEVKLFLEDNLTMDLEYEEWEMNSDGSEIQKRVK
jgi:hypothetical protein